MPFGRTTSIICAVLASCVALAACGGSSGSSGTTPAAYVKSICQAVGPFEKDVQNRSNSLNLSTIKSPAEGKKALQDFLNSVGTDTDTAVTRLKSAGAPSVNNGKQISSAIVNAFSQLRAALGQAASSASSLPTTSAAAFKTAADALGTNVRTSMSSIGSSLSGLKSPALEQAAKKEPTCQRLGA
jgi:hypothetical protein